MDRDGKIEEAFLAPVGSALLSRDTQIVERDGWYQLITPSTGSTQSNEVVLSKLSAEEVDAVVHRTVKQYAVHQVPFKWCVGPLTEPADFGHTLERMGFVGWAVRGMAADPAQWQNTPHEGISIEAVTDANLAEYYGCWVRGWDVTVPDAAVWLDDHARALATGKFRFFLARHGGEPVGTAGFVIKPRSPASAGSLHLGSRCVYFIGGNVLSGHRGQGIYRALLDERMRQAAALGASLVVTQAREATSAPILERLGFESLYTSHVYKWEP